MNTHKRAHIFCKAKARRHCLFIIMCFHLVLGEVPGPCRHSVTKEHLLNLRRLIENQLQNDCKITYTFMERHGLSKVCYVKAAFSEILELLNTHFQYVKGSDNYGYVDKLKRLVFNIYAEECIPQINEEIEDSPVRFAKYYSSSRREALGKIKDTIQLYMELMTENDKPVDWNCEEEYAEDYSESSSTKITTPLAQTTGATECRCSCPTLSNEASEQVTLQGNGKSKPMETGQWKDLMQPSHLQSHSSRPPKLAQPQRNTRSPWDYIPVNHDYNSHHTLRETESIASVRKEEKEAVNGDISSSSSFLTSLRARNLRSTAGSSASFEENNSGPKDPGASCSRVHLDPVPGAPGTSKSPDSSSPNQNRIPGSTRSRSSQRTSFLDSSRVIISSSKEHADNPTTPIPSLKALIRSTPTKPEDTTAVLLVKRSLGPRVEGLRPLQNRILANSPSASGRTLYKNVSPEDAFRKLNERSDISQAGEETRTAIHTAPLPRTTVEKTSRAVSGPAVRKVGPLKHESVPMMTIDEKLESPGLGPQSSAEPVDSKSPSGQAGRDSGKESQKGAQEESSHFSYKIAFIVASVCGGLLLLITLYCFWKPRNTKALLPNADEGNLSLKDKGSEMQHCEMTEQSCLDTSLSRNIVTADNR